jgi:hypothetical protein
MRGSLLRRRVVVVHLPYPFGPDRWFVPGPGARDSRSNAKPKTSLEASSDIARACGQRSAKTPCFEVRSCQAKNDVSLDCFRRKEIRWALMLTEGATDNVCELGGGRVLTRFEGKS